MIAARGGSVAGMAKDSFESALNGFRTWASAPNRSLAGDKDADARELELLFNYMPDYLGISGPAELRHGHIHELLLDVYPRKVVVDNREDTAETIAALRDLLGFLEDTQALTTASAGQLRRELDEVEPEFVDAVMDPSNWGPARAIMSSMLDDGVDLDDQVAVQGWIEQYNAELTDDDIDFAGPDDEPSLKELFGLPDELPPIRLPDDPELAAAARRAPMMAQLAALAEWTGEDGHAIDEDEELYDEDVTDGAASIGVSTDDFRYLW